ncbi:unnamed protein product [Schistocephalus solidus]|uniref:Protein-tyrosine-phosphatase n=1 Tax=Schistocephalus solidus TaxID=70667 RepID=A0A183SVC5_SCHSO|nr:unnamed protein product [Schistocephalus solidus]
MPPSLSSVRLLLLLRKLARGLSFIRSYLASLQRAHRPLEKNSWEGVPAGPTPGRRCHNRAPTPPPHPPPPSIRLVFRSSPCRTEFQMAVCAHEAAIESAGNLPAMLYTVGPVPQLARLNRIRFGQNALLL